MSCFVSQQTMIEDSDCVIFPIVKSRGYHLCKLSRGEQKFEQHSNFHSICYPDTFWEPIGIKLAAKIEDYGRYTLTDTPENRIAFAIFLEQLQSYGLKTEAGGNKSHEHAFEINALIAAKAPSLMAPLNARGLDIPALQKVPKQEIAELWKELTRLISGGRVYKMTHPQLPAEVQLGVCLKSAYTYLVENSEPSFSYRGIKDRIDDLDTELARHQNFSTSKLPTKFAVYDLLKIECTSSNRHRYHTLFHYIVDQYDWEKTPITKQSLAKVLRQLKEPLDFMQFQAGLEELNLRFAPVVYAGQDYGNDIGKSYLKMVKEIARTQSAFIKKKYDE